MDIVGNDMKTTTINVGMEFLDTVNTSQLSPSQSDCIYVQLLIEFRY